MASWKERYKLAVPPRVLLGLAGALWIGVGVMLVHLAVGWLRDARAPAAWLGAAGAAGSLVIHHLGFLRIVDRNLGRIRSMQGRRCAFSFMPLRSYLLVAVMMAMGLALRRSAIPRPTLAVLYLAIGGALVLSSVRYLRALLADPAR